MQFMTQFFIAFITDLFDLIRSQLPFE